MFASCNNYLIQRLNAPEDAVDVAELIGTKASFSHTAQLSGMGSTGWGSVRGHDHHLLTPPPFQKNCQLGLQAEFRSEKID